MRTPFVVFLMFFLPYSALAATISVQSPRSSLHVGDTAILTVELHADVPTNAIELALTYPSDILQYQGYRDGSSLIDFWLKAPTLTTPGEIVLAGIKPNGFPEATAQIVTLEFSVIGKGQGLVTISSSSVYANDGSGSRVPTDTHDVHISVVDGAGKATNPFPDTELPEDFSITITSDPDVYEGRHVAIFSTKDTGSGISRYEVREGNWGSYTITESPYLIADQTLETPLYIKAIDNAGNERIVTTNTTTRGSEGTPMPHTSTAVAGIIGSILLLTTGILLLRRRQPRSDA